jgi:hypothetical protein
LANSRAASPARDPAPAAVGLDERGESSKELATTALFGGSSVSVYRAVQFNSVQFLFCCFIVVTLHSDYHRMQVAGHAAALEHNQLVIGRLAQEASTALFCCQR